MIALVTPITALAVVLLGAGSTAHAVRPPPSRADVAAATQTAQKALKIVVLEGEDAVNIIQQRTAVGPVVEVRDDNDLPVAGVLVRFRTNGTSAIFAGGVLEQTLTTNAAGRAAATGLQPLANGAHQIEISAQYQGLTATKTITQNNFATAAEATKAGRTAPSTAGVVATTAGGGLSKLAIIGLVGAAGAGAAVAVTAGGSDAPVASTPAPPPVAANTAPVLGGVTASRSTALLGTEVAFSSQASDANNDPLTYAWAFGDGATSTDSSPSHAYMTAGPFTARLTVSDGKDSATQQTAITIKSVTGTFVANGLYFVTDPGSTVTRSVPARIVLTLAQSGTAITGSSLLMIPANELQPGTGTVTGSVNRTVPTITLTGRFPQVGNFNFADLVLSLEPGPDVDTLIGSSTRQTLTFTRQ